MIRQQAFILSRTTSFGKMFQKYAEIKGRDVSTLMFIYEGQTVRGYDTPAVVSTQTAVIGSHERG